MGNLPEIKNLVSCITNPEMRTFIVRTKSPFTSFNSYFIS